MMETQWRQVGKEREAGSSYWCPSPKQTGPHRLLNVAGRWCMNVIRPTITRVDRPLSMVLVDKTKTSDPRHTTLWHSGSPVALHTVATRRSSNPAAHYDHRPAAGPQTAPAHSLDVVPAHTGVVLGLQGLAGGGARVGPSPSCVCRIAVAPAAAVLGRAAHGAAPAER